MSSSQLDRIIGLPSPTAIAVKFSLLVLSIATFIGLLFAPVFDGRHLVGTIVCLVLSLALMNAVHRNLVDLMETGVWISPEGSLAVGVFLKDWEDGDPRLRELLGDMESQGWTPRDNWATARVRRKAGLL